MAIGDYGYSEDPTSSLYGGDPSLLGDTGAAGGGAAGYPGPLPWDPSQYTAPNPADITAADANIPSDTMAGGGVVPQAAAAGGAAPQAAEATTQGNILSQIWNALKAGGGTLRGLENIGISAADIMALISNIQLGRTEEQALQQEMDIMKTGAGLEKTYAGGIPTAEKGVTDVLNQLQNLANLTPAQINAMIQKYEPAGTEAGYQSTLQQLQKLANLTPAQVTGGIQQYLQPLNQNLITGVTQNVAQSLAAQGLAQSPGVMAASTAGALAPYEQQNIQQAASEYFQNRNLQQADLGTQLQAYQADMLRAASEYFQARGFQGQALQDKLATYMQQLQLPIEAMSAIRFPQNWPQMAPLIPLQTGPDPLTQALTQLIQKMGGQQQQGGGGGGTTTGGITLPGGTGGGGDTTGGGSGGTTESVTHAFTPGGGLTEFGGSGTVGGGGTAGLSTAEQALNQLLGPAVGSETGVITSLPGIGGGGTAGLAGGEQALSDLLGPAVQGGGATDLASAVGGLPMDFTRAADVSGGGIPGATGFAGQTTPITGQMPGTGPGGYTGFMRGLGGAALMGGVTGALAGGTKGGLGGLIQPGALGAVEGGALGAGLSMGGHALAAALLSAVAPWAIPFVGPILAMIPFLFKGANPNQVPMAQLHQTFDAAGRDILNTVKAGYLSPAQGRQILNVVAQQGMQAAQAKLGTLTGGQGVNQKMINTIQQIGQELSAMEGAIPSKVQQHPFSMTGAESTFLQPGTQGWYPGSVSSGATLAEQLLSAAVNQQLAA